jgi:uncharacterized protein
MRNIIKSLVLIVISLFSGLIKAGSYEDFFKAITVDDVRTVTSLLQRGFDPNTISPKGVHGLFLAVQSDALKTAGVLIHWPKIQVEWRSDKDESPLMLASMKGHVELVNQLIAKDADVNKTGWTPLHYAASGAKAPIILILLEHSAYVDAESPNGSTPLMMAAMYGNVECVKLLLEAGADPTLKNQQGLNAAEFARRASRSDSLMLIEAAASLWGKAKTAH